MVMTQALCLVSSRELEVAGLPLNLKEGPLTFSSPSPGPQMVWLLGTPFWSLGKETGQKTKDVRGVCP